MVNTDTGDNMINNEELRRIIDKVHKEIENDPEIRKRMDKLSKELSTLTRKDLEIVIMISNNVR